MEERDDKHPQAEESSFEDLELEDLMSDGLPADEINLADLGIEESSDPGFEPMEFDDPDEPAAGSEISAESVPDMSDLLTAPEESEEPIALSNDELANILSDTESTEEFTYSHVEGDDFDSAVGISDPDTERVQMEEVGAESELEVPDQISPDSRTAPAVVDDSGFHFDDEIDLEEGIGADRPFPPEAGGESAPQGDFPSPGELEDLEDLEMPSDEEMELHREDEEFLTSLPELGLEDLELEEGEDESEVGVQVDRSFEEEFGGVREISEPEDSDSGIDFPMGMGEVSGFAIDEEEGPITLSEEELGNIMDDVEDTEPLIAEPEALPPLDEPGEPDIMGAEEQPEILLSDEELQSALLDTEDIIDTSEPMATAVPPTPSVFDEGDEGPITLTAEELGNIISDTEDEAIDATAEFPPDTLDEEEKPSPVETVSILDSEEDEGPVALSENELSAILEDVEETSVSEEDRSEFLADEGLDEGFLSGQFGPEGQEGEDHFALPGGASEAMAGTAAAAVTDREPSGVIDEISREQALNKEELRAMIGYLDQLFDKLPDDTVREFSRSEYFDLYKKIMTELGL